MKKFLLFLIGISMFLLVGCTERNVKPTSQDFNTAKEYLETKGYNIVESSNKVYEYTLTKEKLKSMHEFMVWNVQREKAEEYLNKDISLYVFVVDNHILRSDFKVNTKVCVMICEGKVIGGYSFPDNNSYSKIYSLDGSIKE
ncbi:hypothetical protein [Clostridium chrysemydis]|uniref:hypothetical protein n=1 Tax=Clostridium chrysemydis TaxID=2665504 RepID=UPI0018838DC9|nr:hypothetical protein [Clostridium chrysemydis]